MNDKIIHSFQARRQLSQAFDDLAVTESEAELTQFARGIAERFDDELILAELIRRLETPSSQLRGGLGWVAQLLPHQEVTTALLAQAANRQNSPQVRVTAALLLERYFEVELPAGLVSDLDGSNEVALQSLQSAIDEGRRNRFVLLEYVTQMREAEMGVGLAVIDLLSQLPPADQIDMLMLIAHDARIPVSRQAVEQLIALGKSNAAPAAARALHILSHVLPPENAELAARGIRKLQFQGVRYNPPPSFKWQALLSPVDVAGNQTIWFVYRPEESATGTLLGFVINGLTGVLQMFGSDSITRAMLPETPGQGSQVLVNVGNPQPLLMLEGPPNVAHWLVQRSLEAHWRRPDAPGLSGDFELLCELLWQHEPRLMAPEIMRYFRNAPSKDDRQDSDLAALADELARSATDLFRQPVMLTWFAQFHSMLDAMGIDLGELTPAADDMKALEATTATVLRQLATGEGNFAPAGISLREVLTNALRNQAAWLELAGYAEDAQHAGKLADHMDTFPLQENAFLTALIAGALHQSSRTS